MADVGAGPLRVSLLGQVTAAVGERPVELGPARQRALFAVLAAHAGRTVGRDELIAAMWGAAPPATAGGSVYTYVSGLRRALGPARDRLRSGPAGYTLDLDPGDVDAARFQQLTAEPAGADRIEEALALWRGDPYAGLGGPFIELDRERLSELRVTALARRARIRLDAGGDDDLVAELTGLVRDHPLHETLCELLMRALHRAGRPAEALAVFRQAHRTFVRELGVEPGPALRALQRQMLDGAADRRGRRAPATGLAPTVLPTAVARALRDGLDSRVCFGRSDEIGHLRGLVRAVAEGTGGAVWIDGEPGIGKTELLTLAFADAAGLGCQLAWGAADELGRRVPLQVLTRALGLRATSPDRRIAALAAHLHDPAGAPVERVLAYVRATAAVAPLVLIVDDMQWADDTTVLLWERLLTLTARLPLLLVAAARPEPHARTVARLRRSVQARQRLPLDLQPLSDPDIHRLMASLLGAEVGANLRTLAAQAGGNPLYAREMVRALQGRGAVRTRAGVADVDAAVRAGPPPSLLATVGGTLGLLSPGTLEVLRSAAFLGTEFAVDDVAAVTGHTPFDLIGVLEEALAANVVVDAGADLAFRHPFLREVLVDSLPAAERADRRRRTAQALARHAGPATRVAEQLAAGAPVVDEWLLGWLVDHHAEVARQAPQMAGEFFRRALATGVPTPRQRGTLLVALVRLEVRHGRVPVSAAGDPGHLTRMRRVT